MKTAPGWRGEPRPANAAPVGRGSPRHADTVQDAPEDRAILSFSLLLAVLVAGFINSLRYAQTNEALTSALATLFN
ncbi:MAG: hypothetical protein A3D16_13520 [Rhodobacterales bacterium RIFCSPHIGHO2_02_FULL_62_130]|nr:MAG: hypothetical protein A3D16_13520 [Rhodobacterales bacterium RIFCSPHIGHO2_02_FULL_62_130]OHC59984.1 MAG: hypothetical protein A3E48_15690 [Rhodobacterales bacterium RIFCSPHIGHO2_12_FULL_62_75]HCZ01744.1 hypothetical protein [Rhodobacter sp.]